MVISGSAEPLAVGSGGSNTTIAKMNNVNETIAAMSLQSQADAKYDPPAPTPATPQIVQPFCSRSDMNNAPKILCIIGLTCIVYGIIAK